MPRFAALIAMTAAGLSLGGCMREARLADGPAPAERLELRGLGDQTSGGFRLAGAPGRFTRTSEERGSFDPALVRQRGGGSFELAGTPASAALGGRCSWRENKLYIGPISAAPGRLAYSCAFERDGRRIDAALVVEDSSGAFGGVAGRAERTGTLSFEGEEIRIRSVHRDADGNRRSAAPLGYAFEADGREIGSLALDGGETTVFAPRERRRREAVIAAAIALAIFDDPAESQS